MDKLAKVVFALCIAVAGVFMVAPGLLQALPADCVRLVYGFLVVGFALSISVLAFFNVSKRKDSRVPML
ncbi:hypothetical protein V0M98_38605 (plasmid) [Pseudomonas silesiensis]|uniref:hypothetical protein n=1 Tax=Pseudomonas silesiensis TaxID=1853130 RepID=UPI0030D5A5B2